MLWKSFFMRFWCLSTSSYHPVQFQGIIGPCCYLHSGRTDYVDKFFMLNFNMHIHCSLPSWTKLVREACGHHWGLRSIFLTDEICSGGLWVLSLFDLQWCKLPLILSSVFFNLPIALLLFMWFSSLCTSWYHPVHFSGDVWFKCSPKFSSYRFCRQS